MSTSVSTFIKDIKCYTVILFSVLAMMLIFALPAGATSPDDLDTESVIAQCNAARNANGVLPVAVSESLSKAATQRAKEAVVKRSHTRPDGTRYETAVTTAPNPYIGENLAGGSYTAATVVNDWLNSAGHRENILDPEFHYIGVGYYVDAVGAIYWCELFSDIEY